MAKYCGNCGTQLGDNAKVCGNCGTPVDGSPVVIPNVKPKDPEKQKKRKKTVRLILGLAVLAVVAVIGLNFAVKYTGYNGLLRKVMKAYKNYDIDTLVSLSSDMYYYGDEDWVEYYFEYTVGDDLDYFDSYVGHSYKLSYEVNETYTLSEYKMDDMLEEITYTYYDFDVSEISKIVVADVTITAKQGSNSESLERNIVMSREEGSWKLLYIE